MPILFAGALFVSALLLFIVQPLIAKMILPLLGGLEYLHGVLPGGAACGYLYTQGGRRTRW